MTPQDTARAIVEKITKGWDPSASTLVTGSRLAELRAEWVALVVPEVENLHAEAIRRAERAERDLTAANEVIVAEAARARAAKERAEELQSEKDSLTAAYCVTVDAREAAEKERDEFKSALVAEVERGQRLLQTEERLAQRVRDLEAGLRAFVSAFECDFVLDDGSVVDAPERLWSPIVSLYQAARALLSPPPAPQPEEPAETCRELTQTGLPGDCQMEFCGRPMPCSYHGMREPDPAPPTKAEEPKLCAVILGWRGEHSATCDRPLPCPTHPSSPRTEGK